MAAPAHRPGWMRVDRLLGEHGIGEDTAAGREEFEGRMEARRRESTDAAELRQIQRGWCLGSKEFKGQMLEKMAGKLGVNHAGELRRETAEAKAERMIAEEMGRRGWKEGEWKRRRKSDPEKLAIAARVRRETTLTVKWIAARLELGTRESASTLLFRWMRNNTTLP